MPSREPADGPIPGGDPRPPIGDLPVDDRPNSEVVTSLLANGQALIAKEIELAKHELREMVREKALAIGLAAAAALLFLFVLGFVGVTGAVALSLVLPAWAAWLIVTGIYLLGAVIAILIALRLLKRPAFTQTKDSIDQLRSWVKQQVPS